jgi:hypothetical protein
MRVLNRAGRLTLIAAVRGRRTTTSLPVKLVSTHCKYNIMDVGTTKGRWQERGRSHSNLTHAYVSVAYTENIFGTGYYGQS